MRRILPVILILWLLATTSIQAQDVASDLLGRINGLRASLGLPAYTLNGALAAAAQNHAQWMVDTGNISHTQTNGSTPSTRAAAAGYPSSFVSENIYGGTNATPNDAWIFWINSAIHYRGLTNANYTEIGIGSATSSWGRSFVLVFGNPGNPYAGGGGGNNTSRGGNDSAAQAPPSFIVGYDNFGNIMHEIQPEQTIGDIALIYGYTWDDVPYMLQINNLTEADVRLLQVGSVFLVPPYDGTYTPSPVPPDVTLTATPEPPTEVVENAASETPSPEPSPTDTATLTFDQTVLTLLAQTQTAAFEPTPTTEVAVISAATTTPGPTLVAQLLPTGVLSANSDVVITRQNPLSSPLILIAIVVQSLVILAACYEFFRRLRR